MNYFMKSKRILSALLATTLFLSSTVIQPAHAGGILGIVYDPTNWIENALQALTALRQEVLQESELAQMVQQVMTAKNQWGQMQKDAKRMQRSLKGMKASEIFAMAKDINPEMQVFGDLNDRVKRTTANLSQLANQYRHLESMGAYQNIGVGEAFYNERVRSFNTRSADRSFLKNIESTMRTVNSDITQINKIKLQIADTQEDDMQSLRKAMEVATTQLNLMAGQNTQVISLMAEDLYSKKAKQIGDESLKNNNEVAEYKRMNDEYIRAQQLRQASEARFRELWNQPGAR